MQAGAPALGHGGDAGGEPVLVKGLPCALSRARLGLSTCGVHGFCVLVADPVRTPLADGPENVPGFCLAGLARALRVVIRHMWARVRAWCSFSRVTAWRSRHAGSLA